MPATPPQPPRDCALCPRLSDYRAANRRAHPDWFNAPVPSFGSGDARLLVVGLAPGVAGANRTGRPFTGDFAGDLLYATLLRFGFATGDYDRRPDDGLRLTGCRITNAVRCVPPANKPTGVEIRTCRRFLVPELEDSAVPPRAILALGRVAHDSVLSALRLKRAAFPFAHGAVHRIDGGQRLYDSYHCSRYNTNTGRLTPAMFEAVFERIAADLAEG
ncbi:MAG TPA: uracil-DNA glycosylase [Alphaproteobacteria bacterium]|jgi:uracil-DNA glycosylase family 4|nr:uracil-DNA glycosylase [Alphaproteobacteria bacterium]